MLVVPALIGNQTTAGAKVFAAGALDFGGSSTFWPIRRLLENLWARLALP